MGMTDILFNGTELFEQIVNIPSTEDPMRNVVKLVRLFQGSRLKIIRFYTCRGKGR